MSVPTFSIGRTGATLSVTVADSRTGTTFAFTCAAAGSAEWAAILLLERLRADFNGRIIEIRREAYETGWKNAKAHAGKATWFSDCINSKCFGGLP